MRGALGGVVSLAARGGDAEQEKKYTTLHEVALENSAHKCFSYLNKYKAAALAPKAVMKSHAVLLCTLQNLSWSPRCCTGCKTYAANFDSLSVEKTRRFTLSSGLGQRQCLIGTIPSPECFSM